MLDERIIPEWDLVAQHLCDKEMTVTELAESCQLESSHSHALIHFCGTFEPLSVNELAAAKARFECQSRMYLLTCTPFLGNPATLLRRIETSWAKWKPKIIVGVEKNSLTDADSFPGYPHVHVYLETEVVRHVTCLSVFAKDFGCLPEGIPARSDGTRAYRIRVDPSRKAQPHDRDKMSQYVMKDGNWFANFDVTTMQGGGPGKKAFTSIVRAVRSGKRMRDLLAEDDDELQVALARNFQKVAIYQMAVSRLHEVKQRPAWPFPLVSGDPYNAIVSDSDPMGRFLLDLVLPRRKVPTVVSLQGRLQNHDVGNVDQRFGDHYKDPRPDTIITRLQQFFIIMKWVSRNIIEEKYTMGTPQLVLQGSTGLYKTSFVEMLCRFLTGHSHGTQDDGSGGWQSGRDDFTQFIYMDEFRPDPKVLSPQQFNRVAGGAHLAVNIKYGTTGSQPGLPLIVTTNYRWIRWYPNTDQGVRDAVGRRCEYLELTTSLKPLLDWIQEPPEHSWAASPPRVMQCIQMNGTQVICTRGPWCPVSLFPGGDLSSFRDTGREEFTLCTPVSSDDIERLSGDFQPPVELPNDLSLHALPPTDTPPGGSGGDSSQEERGWHQAYEDMMAFEDRMSSGWA